jgi:hypothetical protein
LLSTGASNGRALFMTLTHSAVHQHRDPRVNGQVVVLPGGPRGSEVQMFEICGSHEGHKACIGLSGVLGRKDRKLLGSEKIPYGLLDDLGNIVYIHMPSNSHAAAGVRWAEPCLPRFINRPQGCSGERQKARDTGI